MPRSDAEPNQRKRSIFSYEPMDEEGARATPWGFIAGIIVAKFATIMIVLVISWNGETGLLVASNIWPWFVLIGALVAAPGLVILRKRRVRARRDALIRAEWLIDEPTRAEHPGSNAR